MIPHFRSPFTRDPATGKVSVVEQSTPDHVTSQKWMVVSTPLGFRIDRPDFGWPWPEFAPVPLDLSALGEALQRFLGNDPSTLEEWADVYSQAERKIRVTPTRGT